MNTNTLLVLEKAKKAIKEYAMLRKNATVIVGLSGGADSVCLLHLLHSLKAEYNLKLIASHINHGIRGEEAERDALFSKAFAQSLNVEFKLLNADCIKEANETGESLEEAGRRIRYEFFNSLASEGSVIATAHNSNDNMETVIFNITRGSALAGAKGIPPKRENIIRPLIFCTREEIEKYCEENGLDFVTDSTNTGDDYTRNKIRHLILPELKKLNSSAVEAFSRFSQSVRIDDDYLDSVAENAMKDSEINEFSYSVDIINDLHSAIKTRVIFKAIKRFSGESPDSKKINAVLNCLNENEKIQLYKNCYCETRNGVLKFFDNVNNNDSKNTETIFLESYDFNRCFGEYTIKSELNTKISQKINDLLLDNLIDYDTIYGNLVLRSRKEGDKITLRKRNVTKTLKKLFIEENISREERDVLPVLADEHGVVWVYGFGVNKRNAITPNTNKAMVIKGVKNGFTKNDWWYQKNSYWWRWT